MAKILQFPIATLAVVRPGPVLCPPLGIRFPELWRVEAKTKQEDLDRIGMGDEKATGLWFDYTFNPGATEYVGETKIKPALHIQPGEYIDSLVIRHHPNIQHAYGHTQGYLDALIGKNLEAFDGGLCTTKEGIFTFFAIPTAKEWPGSLVFYLADVPSNNLFGEDVWAYIVGPDGKRLDSESFGF